MEDWGSAEPEGYPDDPGPEEMVYARVEPTARSAELRFEVVGTPTARELSTLCSVVAQIYDALRVARIARPDHEPSDASPHPTPYGYGTLATPTASPSPAPTTADIERELTFVSENLSLLAPESELVIASAAFASPGEINFTGSGEIVEKTADFLQRVYTRGEIKRGAQLDNEAREVAIERERVALSRERGAGDIELSMTRYRALKEVFVDLHGPSILETDAGRAQFREVLSGAGSLDSLAAAGAIRLPPTLTAGPPDDKEML